MLKIRRSSNRSSQGKGVQMVVVVVVVVQMPERSFGSRSMIPTLAVQPAALQLMVQQQGCSESMLGRNSCAR
jgi:hypothetical protein